MQENKIACPYCSKGFKTWKSVRGHTSSCDKNDGSYFIDLGEGALHFSVFEDVNRYTVRNKFPNLKSKLGDISTSLNRRGFNIEFILKWNKEKIVKAIRKFEKLHNKVPTSRDLLNNTRYPSARALQLHFGSFNNAIIAAGFKPNDDGFGISTEAKDGHVYRSRKEADFVDMFLFGKYEYQVEPAYPEPNDTWLYDWYIPELDLYIELDGQCRPERIIEKIQINKDLKRNLLVTDGTFFL